MTIVLGKRDTPIHHAALPACFTATALVSVC